MDVDGYGWMWICVDGCSRGRIGCWVKIELTSLHPRCIVWPLCLAPSFLSLPPPPKFGGFGGMIDANTSAGGDGGDGGGFGGEEGEMEDPFAMGGGDGGDDPDFGSTSFSGPPTPGDSLRILGMGGGEEEEEEESFGAPPTAEDSLRVVRS